MKNENIDEILERIWIGNEKGKTEKEAITKSISGISGHEKLYDELLEKDLIQEKNGKVFLVGDGDVRARRSIRQHRLAEVLMSNVLGVTGEEMEKGACAFEHSLVPEITEGICVLLGHPQVCPHGSLIPSGDCCDHKYEPRQGEAIIPLSEVKTGQEVRVSYLNSTQERRLHYLSSVGINPGSMVRVHQTYPSFVVESGNTQIAMEDKIAGDIYVWKSQD